MSNETDIDFVFEQHNNKVAQRKYELKCLKDLEDGE